MANGRPLRNSLLHPGADGWWGGTPPPRFAHWVIWKKRPTVGGVGNHRVGAEVKKEGRFDTFLEGQAVDF